MSQQVDNKITMQRFGEKLAAVRQGMTAEEKIMLDTMVANTAFEVTSHGIAVRAIPEDVQAHVIVNRGAVQEAAVREAVISSAAVESAVESAVEANDIEDVQAHIVVNRGAVQEAAVREAVISSAAVESAVESAVEANDIEDVQAHAVVNRGAIQEEAAAHTAAVEHNVVYRLKFKKAIGYELSELGDDEDDVQAHAALVI